MTLRSRLAIAGLVLLVTGVTILLTVAAGIADRRMNTVIPNGAVRAGADARALHTSATIVDLHADALLWPRDLNDRHAHGHVDLPRLREGNVALQVFSVVTKTPRGINYERNTAETDNITLLAIAERYPVRAWGSLRERARWQARRFHGMAAQSNGGLQPVTTRRDLEEVLAGRAGGKGVIGGVLATEGLHPIEGLVANLDTLFADGFRVFGVTHFFDNEVGGSAHGVTRGGLTPLGREVVRRAGSLGAIIDLAHASPALFADVLALGAGPVLVSHVGVQATCPGPRNLSDEQLRAVAARGGIVGIGIWDGAICEVTPRSFARAVRHAIEVGGDDVVALGSDFDGATRTPIDASGLDALTEAMLNEGLTADQVTRVLGGNAIAFFRRHLPP